MGWVFKQMNTFEYLLIFNFICLNLKVHDFLVEIQLRKGKNYQLQDALNSQSKECLKNAPFRMLKLIDALEHST